METRMTQPDPNAAPPAAPPAQPAQPAPPAQPPAGKTFTQEELTAVATREKEQGRTSALAQVQTELGVDLEAAKAIIKAAKEREDSQKSDAQKAREAADAEKATAEGEKSAAAQATHTAHVTTEFVLAGITDRTKIERYSRLLDVKVGAKPEDIQKAIEKLKTDEPALFGAPGQQPPTARRTPPSDPKGTPPPPGQSSDAFTRGMERAASHGRGYGWQKPPAA